MDCYIWKKRCRVEEPTNLKQGINPWTKKRTSDRKCGSRY
jgi:hypothetical protein